jgi:hypothetical protein
VARPEDGGVTASAPDVENILPELDLRAGEQPRCQSAQHPLMPLTLFDEFPPAGSVPVLGLLCIHRRECTLHRSATPAVTGAGAAGGE